MNAESKKGTHAIGIPKSLADEIRGVIAEYGEKSYSINSFCIEAIQEMIDLIKSESHPRRDPKLVRMYDAAKADGQELGGARVRDDSAGIAPIPTRQAAGAKEEPPESGDIKIVRKFIPKHKP